MRFYQHFRPFGGRSAVIAGVGLMFVCGPALSAFGQLPQTPPPAPAQAPPGSSAQAAAQSATAAAPPARKIPDVVSPVESGSPLSIEDAVKMALDNNLGIKEARMNPEMQEYALEQIRGSYAPTLTSSFSNSSNASPPTDFISSGIAVVTATNLVTKAGLQQNVKYGGGFYQLSFSGSRGTTDAPRAVFSPQLGSTVTAFYDQPLLRNFRIDQNREQLLQQKDQVTISDLTLRQQITQTSFAVRNAYYNLVGAIESYKVAKESLEIAQQSLDDNQRRLAVGTIPQIDIVSSQAEVASNEELVIIEQGQIDTAEDALRGLVMNSSQPGFWTVAFKPTDPEQITTVEIDVDAAVKNALQSRADLQILKQQIDQNDVALRYNSNGKLPQADLQATYGDTGIGGTQFAYDQTGLSSVPVSQTVRSFNDVLRDVVGNNFRQWNVGVVFSYPIGMSPYGAAAAKARIQAQQYHTQLTDMETQVAIQVREAARQVDISMKRVAVDRRSRQLSQQKLDAEQKRYDVGLSTTLDLFTAERDLATARRAEVAAQIAYSSSLAAFQAIQLAPGIPIQ